MKLKKYGKRVTSLFLALVMVISLFAGFGFETEAADYVQSSEEFADANGDGIINRLDPIRTRKNVAGSVTSNNQSDINGDGLVDTLDIVLSKKMAAGELDEASFYSREITGDTYKFIFVRVANAVSKTTNELTWDAEENAYHYHIDGTVANGYSDRKIWFDVAFINKVIEYTGATSMSFKVKAGVANPWATLYGNCDTAGANMNYQDIQLSNTYQTIEVEFSELPLDDNYNMQMPMLLYQHAEGVSGDLYISDITFHVPEKEKNVTWEADANIGQICFNTTNFTISETTVGGAHNTNVTSQSASDVKWHLNSSYTSVDVNWGRKFTLNTPIKNVTSDMKLCLNIHGGWGDSGEAPFRVYPLDTTLDKDITPYVEAVATENVYSDVIIDLSKLVDKDGTFRGFQFVNYNTSSQGYYFHYIEIISGTPVVEWEQYGEQVYFNEANVTYSNNTTSGLHNELNIQFVEASNYVYFKSGNLVYPNYGQKFTFKTPITNVTGDMKMEMDVFIRKNSSSNETPKFYLYHIDYSDNPNYNYIAPSTKFNEWTTFRIDLDKFIDSDGTLRGFQFGNFDAVDVEYYIRSIQIYREKTEEVWEVHDTRDFNATDFTATKEHTVGGIGQVNAVTAVDDNKLCCANASLYTGAKFTLNKPIAHVDEDMKLRMMVYVTGDSTTTTNFYLYHVDYNGNANYGCIKVQDVLHGAWNIIEVDVSQFLDSDGTFRGFQLGNFDNSTPTYYFQWLDIVKLQEEFDPVDYTLDFAEPNVTVSLNDLDGLNTLYTGTFITDTDDAENEILSFAYNHTTKWPYGGGKVTYKQAIENCTEDMLVTFRVKVTNPESDSTEGETIKLWFYKADAYGKQANNTHTENEVPVGEWTEVSCALKDLMVDGKFDGFFWANASNTYTVAFDSLTVQQSDAILTNGVSAYRLLVPKNSSNLITTATDEFNLFFGEATGTELDVVSDANVVEGQKYISIGETSLLAETNITYETSELKEDGFKIVTQDDNIYVIGGSDYGTLYATYELLAELVNFDYFYKDAYALDKNVTDIALQEFAITEVPDIAIRTTSDGVVQGDPMSMYRMRVRPYSESMIWTGTDWVHTSFHFVKGVESDGTTNANIDDNWFNDNKTQLCYTAHGDSGAYEAMLDASLNTLKGAIKRFGGIRRNVVFGNQDNDDTCTCDTCAAMKNQYGADSAAAISFLDDLRGKLDDWFATEEGQAYAGEFNIIFLAYKGYEDAPTTLPSGLKYDINCMICAIEADYYQPIASTNTTNATYYNTITSWGNITDNLYTWYYGTNFKHYLAPYDNISNMQENYQLAVSSEAGYMFDQRQHNESGFVTGWSNLKSYLSSKLMWDVNADVNALTGQFFEAYFGPAATNMRKYYEELTALTKTNLSKSGFGGVKSVVQEDLCSATYWPKTTLETWLGYCDTALTDIESLESSNPTLYQKYKNHIEGEKLAILYLYIESHLNYSNAVAMYPYMQQVQRITNELGITRYSEAGAIKSLLDKWGVSAADPQVVWTHGTEAGGADSGFDGVNESGTISYDNNVWKVANCYCYSAHKLAFVNPQTYTGNETVTISIKATPNTSGMNNLKLYLYPYSYTGQPSSIDYSIREYVTVNTQGTDTTISFDIKKLLDSDGTFVGFGFMTYNYGNASTGQMYTIEIKSITVN